MDDEEIARVGAESPTHAPAILDLGPTADVLVKGRAIVEVGPAFTPILIVRTIRGVFAVENRCPHRGVPLSDARAHGRNITCPLHGLTFDMTSGSCRTRGKAKRPPLPLYRAWTHRGRLYLALPGSLDK